MDVGSSAVALALGMALAIFLLFLWRFLHLVFLGGFMASLMYAALIAITAIGQAVAAVGHGLAGIGLIVLIVVSTLIVVGIGALLMVRLGPIAGAIATITLVAILACVMDGYDLTPTLPF